MRPPAPFSNRMSEHKPFVVSMDGNDAAYDLIREGSPLALTVAYDVRGMGMQAVQAVADAVDGKSFERAASL